jgi:hypothetical protein
VQTNGYGASNGYGGGYGGPGYGSTASEPRATGHASFHNSDPASHHGDSYRMDKGILVTGRDVPEPVKRFEDAGFTREILSEVRI